MITCPECHNSNVAAEWDQRTRELCGGYYTPLKQGYGALNYGYHCPSCLSFIGGRRLKEYNDNNSERI